MIQEEETSSYNLRLNEFTALIMKSSPMQKVEVRQKFWDAIRRLWGCAQPTTRSFSVHYWCHTKKWCPFGGMERRYYRNLRRHEAQGMNKCPSVEKSAIRDIWWGHHAGITYVFDILIKLQVLSTCGMSGQSRFMYVWTILLVPICQQASIHVTVL